MSKEQIARRSALIISLTNKLGRQREAVVITQGHILDLQILNESANQASRQLEIEDSKEAAGKPSSKK